MDFIAVVRAIEVYDLAHGTIGHVVGLIEVDGLVTTAVLREADDIGP